MHRGHGSIADSALDTKSLVTMSKADLEGTVSGFNQYKDKFYLSPKVWEMKQIHTRTHTQNLRDGVVLVVIRLTEGPELHIFLAGQAGPLVTAQPCSLAYSGNSESFTEMRLCSSSVTS